MENFNNNGYLYHGSSISNLKKLEPRKSTHGTYVYATPYKELTYIFSGRAGDDLTMSLYRYSDSEPWNLVERIPNGFAAMFNNESSIYTISAKTFKDIHTGFAEVVSELPVDILEEEKVPNVYIAIQELANKGLINIYHYPNRPLDIPTNDEDLIECIINQSKKDNEPLTRFSFERLIMLHPGLITNVNKKILELNLNIKPFTKEDLVPIFEKHLFLSLIKPEREQYLASAIKSISSLYSELFPLLEEKYKIINLSPKEKIQKLIESLSNTYQSIDESLVEELKLKYLNDQRPFPLVAEEIIKTFQSRHTLLEDQSPKI